MIRCFVIRGYELPEAESAADLRRAAANLTFQSPDDIAEFEKVKSTHIHRSGIPTTNCIDEYALSSSTVQIPALSLVMACGPVASAVLVDNFTTIVTDAANINLEAFLTQNERPTEGQGGIRRAMSELVALALFGKECPSVECVQTERYALVSVRGMWG